MNTQTRIQSQSKHTQILISIPIVTAKRKERWTWCHDGLGGPRWWSGGERRKREREGEGWVGCVIALMEQLGQEDAGRKN